MVPRSASSCYWSKGTPRPTRQESSKNGMTNTQRSASPQLQGTHAASNRCCSMAGRTTIRRLRSPSKSPRNSSTRLARSSSSTQRGRARRSSCPKLDSTSTTRGATRASALLVVARARARTRTRIMRWVPRERRRPCAFIRHTVRRTACKLDGLCGFRWQRHNGAARGAAGWHTTWSSAMNGRPQDASPLTAENTVRELEVGS
mmetsp:Transcript_66383/g.176720  ORF Transcript_66383/g.176720 Transcript_66383/m.176720 type:complete len:203 (+) Transcript_66383:672-1280(+)